MSKELSMDDIEFVDAVFSIPKNSVLVKFEIQSYEQGELRTIEGTFDPSDVRDAIGLFEKTVNGDYPLYALTDKGKEYAEELMKSFEF